MKVQWKPEQLWKLLDKYKYVLLILAAGVLLLLWPAGEKAQPAPDASQGAAEAFDLAALEEKISRTLSQVEGAGEVTVVLTLQGGPGQVLAQDGSAVEEGERTHRETSTILLSKGSGYQEPAVLQELGPVYQGALVVCPGGEEPRVKLALCQAVSALTGLRTDQISICKGK